MAKFIQLETLNKVYDKEEWYTEMQIVNIDHIVSADLQTKGIQTTAMFMRLSERGWGVLMEAIGGKAND